MATSPIDLRQFVQHGALFHPFDDPERIDAFIPPMGHENHAANLIELPNGDLLCAWFAGTREAMPDIRIALARLPAGSDRWLLPQWVTDDPAHAEQNPVLFLTPAGELWLIYTAQQTRDPATLHAGQPFYLQDTAVIRRKRSNDFGLTWGPAEPLIAGPGVFCRHPPRVLSNGDWLLPFYYCNRYNEAGFGNGHFDHSAVRISSDAGKTWEEYDLPGSRGRVQASVNEVSPGCLIALLRSRSADRIYISHSRDFGRTWTAPARTPLPNNNSSVQCIRLHTGELALAFNPLSHNDDPEKTVWQLDRHPLTFAISEDEGETWPWMRHIDMSDGFCGERNRHLNRGLAYPSIIQTRDGMLHVAYSYRPRACIKHTCFALDWVKRS
jgi:predicted neuraminidase